MEPTWWSATTTTTYDAAQCSYALTQINQWRIGVLVDEAHNLLDRARRMYTASLDQAAFDGSRARRAAACASHLTRVARSWSALKRAQTDAYQVYASAAGNARRPR